jgi:hypothetical protein
MERVAFVFDSRGIRKLLGWLEGLLCLIFHRRVGWRLPREGICLLYRLFGTERDLKWG